MIKLTNVSKAYGSFWAVRDISFEVARGEVVGLVGPNGAGKTTIMKMVTGYIVPTTGSVEIDGTDMIGSPTDAQHRIGYLPEHNPLYPEMTVRDYLIFLGRMRGLGGSELKARLSVAAGACGVTDVLGRQIRHLSKGYRQRVGIAQAMIHDPDILILDEPTSGLDPNQIIEIRHLIRELGQDKTVILSTHILSEVEEACSRAIIIVAGSIGADDRIEDLAGSKAMRFVLADASEGRAQRIGELEEVAEVVEIREGVPEGATAFLISPAGDGRALGRALHELAVRESWPVEEIAHQRHSLEDAFRAVAARGGQR